MRRLILAPLLVSAGCLYLGDLNHPPKIDDVSFMAQDHGPLYKGTPIEFDLSVSDAEDSPEQLTLRPPQVRSLDGSGAVEGCDYVLSDEGNVSFVIAFLHAGSFVVVSTVQDSQGAISGGWSSMLTIGNAPPSWQSDSMLTPAANENLCGVFNVGQGIPIQVVDPKVVDPDQSVGSSIAGCPMPETLTYTWTVTPPPGSTMSALTPWDPVQNKCVPVSMGDGLTLTATTPDQVCLWPDFAMQDPTGYQVTLGVSDGTNAPATLTQTIPVESNSLPCLAGEQPTVGSFVVDPANPEDFAVLTVNSVKDDLDVFPCNSSTECPGGSQIQFFWSLWRESDPVWRDIATTDNSYMPDYSIFGVGEHVRVRVEAVDRSGVRASASCPDPSVDLCQIVSCASPTSACYQWVTWDLELR